MNSHFYISFMVQNMFCNLAAFISLFSLAVYVFNCILINAFHIYILVMFLLKPKILFSIYILSSSVNFAFVVKMFSGGNGACLD